MLVGLVPACADRAAAARHGRTPTARARPPGRPSPRPRRAGGQRSGAVDRAVDGRGPGVAQFLELLSVDPGFRTDRVLTASITLPVSAYPDPERTSRFFASLLDRLRAQPGITAAGAVTRLPLADGGGDLNFQIEGRETPPGTLSRRADWQVVTPGYFDAMGMRVVQGRGIEPGRHRRLARRDRLQRERGPAALAQRRRARRAPHAWRPRGPGLVTVVGIVNDIRTGDLTVAPRPEMYLAHTQFRMFGRGTEPMRTLSITVRTVGGPGRCGRHAATRSRRAGPQPVGGRRADDGGRARHTRCRCSGSCGCCSATFAGVACWWPSSASTA